MSNIAGSSVYSSANTSTSTLRPRNNRLISYLDEGASEHDIFPQPDSTTSSRGASPSTNQSRGRNLVQSIERTTKTTTNTVSENSEQRSSSLWDSWTSIQGVASSFLGGDNATAVVRRGSIKTPAWMKQDQKFKTAPKTSEWGPDAKSNQKPTPASIEDRQAKVQAKKREALLLSCAQEGRDGLGHYKRKGSYDASAEIGSLPNSEIPDDALVYQHKVQPNDTMAGVTIKFGCQPEAFRKINRFWPNDNIQTRVHVLLPVAACTVRGRKVDDASSLELLAQRLNSVELDSTQRSIPSQGRHNFTDISPVVASPKTVITGEEDYQHDSFVILPSFPEPVEILRIPRRSLGYFPRTRRKSLHATSETVTSTPKTSFDMLRHPPTHAAQQAAAALNPSSHSLNVSPIRRPRLTSTSRQRSSSTTTTTTAHSNNAWILRGPGGVGTLTGLRTEMSRPGPSDDPLNQKFAQYFPSLATQPHTDDLDPNSLAPRSRNNTTSRSPYRSTPRASMDSIRSTRSNSSTFGGVTGVESFMRKLASGKRPDLPRTNSGNVDAMGLPVGGESGLGDLIELETNPDALNSAAEMDSWGRRRDESDDDATPTDVGRNHEDLLNERFPVRGRITRAYDDDGR